MKYSINKIFNNLSIYLWIILIFSFVIVLLFFELNISYTKINSFKDQQQTANTLINLKQKDVESALIQFNGESTQLNNSIDKLRVLENYHYTNQYLLNNSEEFLSDLNVLSNLINKFNSSARQYYVKDLENEEEKNLELQNNYNTLQKYLDNLILKNIKYNEEEFNIIKNVGYVLLFLTFIIAIWYTIRLRKVYSDILNLYAIGNNVKSGEPFSEEVDSIKLRMNKKPIVADNPDMIDPITQINNHKGMLSLYSHRKIKKENCFTSITVLEIDNFSKHNRAFSKELTQLILKKVAFNISLHKQVSDIIARTDYNEFTIILSRASREQAFKDIDLIHKSICEIKFKAINSKPLVITTSAGFIIKKENLSLERSIQEAKKVLEQSKTKGTNILTNSDDKQIEL